MKHGSLFSGVGGFDLAAEWMGWENVMHCEKNPFGRKVLSHYWPSAKSYEDITKTDFTIWQGLIDIVTGGFPCQPFSTAGQRKGTEDERHLWPEMLRAIRQIKPRWIVGENVRGLTSWNDGLVFEQVQSDLEAEAYEVFPIMVPACGVNAPHKRERIWFIAYADNWIGQEHGLRSGRKMPKNRVKTTRSFTNTDRFRQSRQGRAQGQSDTETKEDWKKYRAVDDGRWPTQPAVCFGNDGVSSGLDGITFSKWRKESLMAAGNAVVPQLVHQIFKSIEQYELNQ